MKSRPIFRTLLLLVTLGTLAPSALAQETAHEIVAKANARLQNVKTYQCDMLGRIQMRMLPGVGDLTLAMRMTFQTAGKKSRTEGTAESISQGKVVDNHLPKMLVIGDEKKWQIVSLTPGKYSIKEVSVPKSPKNYPAIAELPNAHYTLLPSVLLDDKPAYVLKIVSKMPVKMVGKKSYDNITQTYYVDKATYRVKKIRVTMPFMGGIKPADFTFAIENEKIDEPLPDNLFKFIPPRGAIASKDDGQSAQNPGSMLILGMLMGGQMR